MPAPLSYLDPAYPPLWRDGETLQFGVDTAVRLHVDGTWVEPLVARLRRGIRLPSFDVVAHSLGAPREGARAVLETLRPLLREQSPPPPPVQVESLNLADSRAEVRMRLALDEHGLRAPDAPTADTVSVVLVQGAVAAAHLHPHLRDDRTHLPIGFEPGAFTVGPLVAPGRTPCLSCRDGHARDRDPSWPLVHTQLIGDDRSPPTAATIIAAASFAARIITDEGEDGRWIRVGDDDRRVWRSERFHEECRCRDPWSLSPRGTETDHAASDLPPSSATAYARPA